MGEPDPRRGLWTVLSIAVLPCLLLWTGTSRFEVPEGEKFFSPLAGGSADFRATYPGAQALVRGVDPYHHDEPDLVDPIMSPVTIDGRTFRCLYPPTHLLLYVPLVRLVGDDTARAAVLWFRANQLMLVALAAVTVLLARAAESATDGAAVGGGGDASTAHVGGRASSALVGGLALAVYSQSPGGQLGLERGQSYVLQALLTWGAAWWLVRSRLHGGPTRVASFAVCFLSVAATLVKGPTLLFGAGLCLLALGPVAGRDRRRAVAAVAGGAAAIGVLLLPVARHVPDGFRAAAFFSNSFERSWINHGFENLAWSVAGEGMAGIGRIALTVLALVVTVLVFVRTRRAFATGTPADAARWLSWFGVCAGATMVGYPGFSGAYNLVLLLPGIVVAVLSQDRFADAAGLGSRGRAILGATALAATVLVVFGKLPFSSTFPLASVGLVAWIGLSAWLATCPTARGVA